MVTACGAKRTKTAADHLDVVGLHGRIILNMQSWLRMGFSGGLLYLVAPDPSA